MAGKVYFILGFHNHQPIGNFDFVIEDAYEKSYLPFVEVLEEFPFMKVSLHYTGILWDWFENNKPDFLDRLKALVSKGQVELLSGGYYEPIMSVIPEKTRKWQLEKMNQYIEDTFGNPPRGMWLAERVWEPQLVQDIARTGLEFTITDDSHFKCAGLSEDQTYGYYLSEEQNDILSIFPISERLRYTIPFMKPEASFDFFKSVQKEDEDVVVVMADDGEKFGVWPGTYEHVYEKGWLRKFFEMLGKENDWVVPVTFSWVLDHVEPLGKTFLPTASYQEMMEWAMPTDAIHKYEEFLDKVRELDVYEPYKEFVRGGFWRNFICKYDETNNMHKKMLETYNYFVKVMRHYPFEERILTKAKDCLLKAQCNCSYWHGVFGGLYLNFLRQGVYENLLMCEEMLNHVFYRQKNWLTIEEEDFLKTREDEIIVKNRFMNCYIDPAKGGSMFELDFLPCSFNFGNTMTRREEAYHKKIHDAIFIDDVPTSSDDGEIASIHDIVIVKERDLDQYLVYDKYRKTSFIDHVLIDPITLDQLDKNQINEAVFLPGKKYESSILSQDVLLAYQQKDLYVEKHLFFVPDCAEIKAQWKVKGEIGNYFAAEFNLGLLSQDDPQRYILINGDKQPHPFNAKLEEEDVQKISIIDRFIGYCMEITLAQPAKLICAPLFTVSLSETGGEKIYQNTTLYFQWALNHGALNQFDGSIQIRKLDEV